MGIKGLLPLLSAVQEDKRVSDFAGQTAGIDGYVWLHRAAYVHATELGLIYCGAAENTAKDVEQDETDMAKTRRFKEEAIWKKMAATVLRYCQRLQQAEVIPHVVFDGGFLPMKEQEERGRDDSRKANLEKAFALWKSGQKDAAHKAFAGAYDIVPEMACWCCRVFDAHGIPYTVAPYEADAQLGYMAETGQIDFVITEDSDLLPFRTPSVLYKLDFNSMTGKHVCLARDFCKVFGSGSHLEKVFSLFGRAENSKGGVLEGTNVGGENAEKELSSTSCGMMENGETTTSTSTLAPGGGGDHTTSNTPFTFDYDRFLAVCILLGCDYGSTTISKCGPKKVCELVAKAGCDPDRIQRCARFEGYDVDACFVENFTKAWLCFRYQTVYCSKAKTVRSKCLLANPVPGSREDIMVEGILQEGGDDAGGDDLLQHLDDHRIYPEDRSDSTFYNELARKVRARWVKQIQENTSDLFCGHRYDAETAVGVAVGRTHPETFARVEFNASPEQAVADGSNGTTSHHASSSASSLVASRPGLLARTNRSGNPMYAGLRDDGGAKRRAAAKNKSIGPEPGQMDILAFFQPPPNASGQPGKTMLPPPINLSKSSKGGRGGAKNVPGGSLAKNGSKVNNKEDVQHAEGQQDTRYIPSRYRTDDLRASMLADGAQTNAGLAKFEAMFASGGEVVGGSGGKASGGTLELVHEQNQRAENGDAEEEKDGGLDGLDVGAGQHDEDKENQATSSTSGNLDVQSSTSGNKPRSLLNSRVFGKIQENTSVVQGNDDFFAAFAFGGEAGGGSVGSTSTQGRETTSGLASMKMNIFFNKQVNNPATKTKTLKNATKAMNDSKKAAPVVAPKVAKTRKRAATTADLTSTTRDADEHALSSVGAASKAGGQANKRQKIATTASSSDEVPTTTACSTSEPTAQGRGEQKQALSPRLDNEKIPAPSPRPAGQILSNKALSFLDSLCFAKRDHRASS
ncbi:unnamed protein product [Amoebophrya sp. A25]|nr:unnamed protein product [Amoebophrya sp. A25]|eukprot:GSA25T00019041001.1